MSAASVAAAIARAVKASGTIVRVEPEEFLRLLNRQQAPLVVHATVRLSTRRHRYLTSYKGLAFFTKSSEPLSLPRDTEQVVADSIWMP